MAAPLEVLGLAACDDSTSPPGADSAVDSSADLGLDLGVDTLPADLQIPDLPPVDLQVPDLPPTDLKAAADVTGSWVGTYTSGLAGTGTLTASFVQTGNQVKGTISIPLAGTGSFTGTVAGSVLTGSGTAALGTATVKLTIAAGGNAMSGTYTGSALGFTDKGTASLSRVLPDAVP